MKLIVAIIRPEKLHDVRKELGNRGIFNMTVDNCVGSGHQKGFLEIYRGIAHEIRLLKKTQVVIAVSNSQVKKSVSAIESVARTGSAGDGMIFVIPLQDVVRIRTGEKGQKALSNAKEQ